MTTLEVTAKSKKPMMSPSTAGRTVTLSHIS